MNPSPLTLLVRDREGYANLCRLITRGRLRNEKGKCSVTIDEVCSYAGGLIALWDMPAMHDAGYSIHGAVSGVRNHPSKDGSTGVAPCRPAPISFTTGTSPVGSAAASSINPTPSPVGSAAASSINQQSTINNLKAAFGDAFYHFGDLFGD